MWLELRQCWEPTTFSPISRMLNPVKNTGFLKDKSGDLSVTVMLSKGLSGPWDKWGSFSRLFCSLKKNLDNLQKRFTACSHYRWLPAILRPTLQQQTALEICHSGGRGWKAKANQGMTFKTLGHGICYFHSCPTGQNKSHG